MAADINPPARLTLRRENFSGIGGRLRRIWATRWGKIAAIVIALPILFYFLLLLLFARGLPSAESLLTYQPPLPTNVRSVDGEPVQTFARERRVQLKYDEFPPRLIQAFISAEDRTFFSHGGIDYPGLVGAVFDYVRKAGSGERARGGSTITQQVAKNLLLNNQYSVTRKIKEAFLARRIEHVLTKQQILELYLNQIFLGRNAYGVQSAARAYFDKDVDQLDLHEAAFLAILPKGPSNYSPGRFTERALERRNWVLGEMARNGFITTAERDAARAMPLGTVRGPKASKDAGGYFMEELRRELVDKYGEGTEKGQNGLYSGGLWVRSSYNPDMQKVAENALRDGLTRFDGGRSWLDPKLHLDMSKDWRSQLVGLDYGVGYDDWRPAVVISKEAGAATIGFTDGSTGTLPASGAAIPKRGTQTPAFEFLDPGTVIAVKQDGANYSLRVVPEISGAITVEEVASGRVFAMQGGFDAHGSSFNRVTQALRQPGSTFKPIVYSAALDNGMTPATLIVDGPFCVNMGTPYQKCFRNFEGGGGGPQTMRWGLEQSRNLMTVRAASEIGMDKIIRRAHDLGVGDFPNFLSIALGAGETTLMKMTNAFSILANQGRALKPSLIDYIEDRNGKVIFRADTRPCDGCNAPDWDGKPMPRPPLRTKQLVDPMTAYQMVHILEGVVTRGTAARLHAIGRPLFGKTGTTNGPRDVWFIGGTPDVVAGAYLGYDKPRSLGGAAQGARQAAPIVGEFISKALKDWPTEPFRAPAGIRMVRIDRRSGQKVFGPWPDDGDPKAPVIWEAFKPESEPKRAVRQFTEQMDIKQALAEAQARVRASRAAAAAQSSDSVETLQSDDGIY